MPPVRGRKRPVDRASPQGSGKRTRKQYAIPPRCRVRDISPSKNVHFPRNLIIGPNESDPCRRSESPVRSALHKPEDHLNSPGAQLRAEQQAALRSSVKEKVVRSRKSTKAKKKTALLSKKRKQAKSKIASPVKDSPEEDVDAVPVDGLMSIGPFDLLVSHDGACDKLNDLRAKVQSFAESFPPHKRSDPLMSLLKPENKQLIRYIGCLALGGKNGVEGWRELLSNTQCRHAIVLGIIGRALKEAVFDDLCFGADPELQTILREKEQSHVARDGFFRTRDRALTISKYEESLITSSWMGIAVARTTLQLEQLLLPLWKQGGTTSTWKSSGNRQQLAQIVASAAKLSVAMRMDWETVYYWPPTFKDEEFEPARVECVNLRDMITNSPYEAKKTDAYPRAVLRKGHEHRASAVVRVVCFPGVVAYQQGGGELAEEELAKESRQLDRAPPDVRESRRISTNKYGEALTGNEGFRTKVVCKAAVFLQWGKQRLFTKEAGTSNHRDAMKEGGKRYEQDSQGFVELYDLFVEEMSRLDGSLPSEGPVPPRQSWITTVPRLFSRSPSVH